MKVQLEAITPVKTKLTIEVEPEDLKKEEEAVVKRIARSVSIPGFRKGKAPSAAIRKMYGDQVRSEAVSNVIHTTYGEALKEKEVWPVADPDIEVQKLEDGELHYTAVVEVRPTVEPKGYKGLELKKEELSVDSTEVDARLESLRQQSGSFEESEEDYAAANGDMAVVDFLGKLDGEPFEGGKAEGHAMMLGAGQMIPGFEEGVVGMKKGEERTIDVSFPAEYHAEHLAGKPAQFDIKVNEVRRRVLPELDDEFAKKTGQFDTFDELKAKVAEMAEQEHANRIERDFKEVLIDKLLAANPFEVPDSLVERQKNHSIDRMVQDMTQRGMNPADAGIDDPKFQDEARRAAERSVRWAFLSDAIARAEQVEVTDEDVDERIRMIAEADGRPYTEIRKFFNSSDHMDSLRNTIREKKTIDAVLAEAKIEEVSADEWEKSKGEK